MPPKKGGGAKPKKTASGYRMPDHLNPGTTLTDLTKKQWVLGKSIGTGGFGEIYLATEGGKGEEKVVKIEPHENGPLFVEMHFYIAAGKPEYLQQWKKGRKKETLPNMPLLRGHGSYQHKPDDTYRFLVIDRLGMDLDKMFKNGAKPLPIGTVANVSVQVINTLEYIHSKGFTHNDVKAANLLLGGQDKSKDVFLVDFGLCVKYIKNEAHIEYKADPRKAHNGTIEYLSRDAHIGCTSRRSDLEVLGFNIIHWLTGSLPWLGVINNPGKVQAEKESYMKDSKNLGSLPKSVQQFMKYVGSLKFEEAPEYDKLRDMFSMDVKKSGGILELSVDDGVKSSMKDVNKENHSSPVKKGKRALAKKLPVVETDSDEEFDVSPVPAKKVKKALVTKANGKNPVKPKESESEDADSDDMFCASPSPVKKIKSQPKFQEAACQTSPAFVAAARAARKGKKAIALSEDLINSVNGEISNKEVNTLVKSKGTPRKAVAGHSKGKVETPTRQSGRSTPIKTAPNGDSDAGTTIPGISNPTPAMLEIFQRKREAEEEKAAKKRKKK